MKVSKLKRFTYHKFCDILHHYMLNLLGIWVYPSYWNYKTKGAIVNANTSCFFYTARPNPGAGIGHQMANWIAGYWYAKQFGLRFAHIPFSNPDWEQFLGFSDDEVNVYKLKKSGYKVRRLPLFDEHNPSELQLQRDIIASYSGEKIVFIAEQDQFYADQFGVMDHIKKKFYGTDARKFDKLIFSPQNFNIAIHVRRGDIMADSLNSNLAMRYLSNNYYYSVLMQVLAKLHTEKPVHVYLFSQGTPKDFQEFSDIPNIHWCLDMPAMESFLHMVYADLLITSKSSFSYKPALLNNGIKVCPKKFLAWLSRCGRLDILQR